MNNFINELTKKIKEFISNNPIKSISFISSLIGSLYLLFYFFQINYLPKLSLEEIMILSYLYFMISIIIIAIIIILFTFALNISKPLIFTNSIPIIRIMSISIVYLIILILLMLFFNIYTFLIMIFLFSAFIISIISSILNKKKILLILNIIFFIFLLMLSIYKLSDPITRIFQLGDYNATLYITNPQLCKNLNLKINKQNICIADKNNTKILWSFGEKYLIEINNTKYKISEKYILTEDIPILKNNSIDNNNSKNKKGY